jgi:inosose dehydratase
VPRRFFLAEHPDARFNAAMQSSTLSLNVVARQSRRDFLCAVGAAAAGALTFPAIAAPALKPFRRSAWVGSNIFGWTQYAARDKKKLDVEEVISALRDCGYDYLESFMDVKRPEENGRFAGQLKAKGLHPVSLYVGGRFHEADKAADTVKQILVAAKVCQGAGFKVISCNPDPIGREKTDPELKTQAAALSDLGEGLTSLGLKLGIHHHLPEMANSAREFHYNFQHTVPDAVGWCYDVHWVWKGGVMPLQALNQYGGRLVTWHLRQSRDNVWWEQLDQGDVDYDAVARYAKAHRLPRRFTVELAIEPGTQITRGVVENHRRSRAWVRKTFGV